MSWDDFGSGWLKSGLPVFDGGKNKTLARKAIDKLGGPESFRTEIALEPDGTKIVTQTKGTMPPQVFVYPAMKVADPDPDPEADYIYVGERYTGTNARVSTVFGAVNADPQKLTISGGAVVALEAIPNYTTSNKYGRYKRWRGVSGDEVYYRDSSSQTSSHSETVFNSSGLTIYVAGGKTAPYNEGVAAPFAGIVTVAGTKYIITGGGVKNLLTGVYTDIGTSFDRIGASAGARGYFAGEIGLFRNGSLGGYAARGGYTPTEGDPRVGAFSFDALSKTTTAECVDSSTAALSGGGPWAITTSYTYDGKGYVTTETGQDSISISTEGMTSVTTVVGGVEVTPGVMLPVTLTSTCQATGAASDYRYSHVEYDAAPYNYKVLSSSVSASQVSNLSDTRTNTVKCGDTVVHSWAVSSFYEYTRASEKSDGVTTFEQSTWDFPEIIDERCSLLCDAGNGVFAFLIVKRSTEAKKYITGDSAPASSDRNITLSARYVIYDAREKTSYSGSFSPVNIGTVASTGVTPSGATPPTASIYPTIRKNGSGTLSYQGGENYRLYIPGMGYGGNNYTAASVAWSSSSSMAWHTYLNLPDEYDGIGFFGSIFADDNVLLCSIRCPYDETQHINVCSNRKSGAFSSFDSDYWYQVLYKAPTNIPATVTA